MRNLTPKQQSFINEYLIDPNATQAAIRAGYSKKTAHVIGQENLHKPAIAAALARRQADAARRVDITLDGQIARHREIALAAEAAGQYSAANQAETQIDKLCGMVTERQEVKTEVVKPELSDFETARAISFLLTRGAQAKDGEDEKVH